MLQCPRAALAFILAIVALILPTTASAAVQVHFYSREFGNQFPHAFIIVKGTLQANGAKVSANYGFTAVTVTPGILLGPVNGAVEPLRRADLAGAERQFTLTIGDAAYARLVRKVSEYRALTQPSYSLDKRNCVHFVMELAATLGLKVNRKSKFFRDPQGFLAELRALNPGLT